MLMSLLIFCIIAAIILFFARTIIVHFKLGKLGNIIYGIIAIILLFAFLNEIGLIGPAHYWRTWR